jgi:ABC-2 type transport system permease protein
VIRPALAVVIRLLAFVGKELVETVRRPGAVISLVVGPFLIMAVFGFGYNGIRRPLETIVVVPPTSGLPTDAAVYQEIAGSGLNIADVTADRAAAMRELVAGAADVVVVAPDDPDGAFRQGRQSVIDVAIDTIDPVEASYAGFLASRLAGAVNEEIIRRAATETQAYAVAAGEETAANVSPDVVAAPTRAEIVNTAPFPPSVVAYFGPAVLALVLQHLAVTLVALSLVRERMGGIIELFRIAPVSTAEVLTGKIFAYGLIGIAVAGIMLAVLVAGLSVPFVGEPAAVAAALGLLLLASLGLGLLIAVVSDSEQQAVQLSLLILLASVFFSGFVLAIDEFNPPVRAIAFALPVTHGIRLLQDLMLRGSTGEIWEFAALAIIAGVTVVAAWGILRRTISRA